MLAPAIAFLLGIILLQQFSFLPDEFWLLVLPSAILLSFYKSRLQLLFVLCSGFLWALLIAHIRMSSVLPGELEGQDLSVKGYIASIPVERGRITRFEFDIVEQLDDLADVALPLPMRVRLNWYHSRLKLSAGDEWTLKIRLKKPYGFMNPGGFDYEGWLLGREIMATGYVRKADSNLASGDTSNYYGLTRLRQIIVKRLEHYLKGSQQLGVITALAVGERQDIQPSTWDLFIKTGTSHLIAISGLHIGLVAGAMFAFMSFFWKLLFRFVPSIAVRYPAKSVASLVSLISAVCYAGLAGFSLPTVRATLMLAVVLFAILLRRQSPLGLNLSFALLLVLVMDPFAVNSAGFWLSFIAVAVLLFSLGNVAGREGGVHSWVKVQVVLTFALIPLSLIWFQRAALFASVANFIAIPLVGFLVVPLILLSLLLMPLSDNLAMGLLWCADQLLMLLMLVLKWMSDWPLAQWGQHSPVFWTWVPAIIGVILFLLPRGTPGRWLSIVCLLPVLLVTPAKPKQGDVWFTLLDVGQGLSAVLQTQHHVLVYDAGPKFSEQFDTGQSVIVPYLRERGIRKLDMLLVSHGDNDHIGGAASLLKIYPASKVLSSTPQEFDQRSFDVQSCERGLRWQWDEVDFEILHPRVEQQHKGNNGSCVLKVSAHGQHILLTGDIEKSAEKILLASGQDLRAAVVTAPHHGSRTSSSNTFIEAVAPEYVLFATGYRNRYGFPKPDIVERYTRVGAKALISYQLGAVDFKLSAAGLSEPSYYRQAERRYWHH